MSCILLIVADPAACAELSNTIGSEPTLAVSAAVDTLEKARAAIARRVPDLIIADLRLPDGPLVNLLDALRPNRSHLLVLTSSLRDPHLMHTLRHGADAYFVTARPPRALLSLIRLVLAGESTMAPEIARQVLLHFDALKTRPIAAGTHAPIRLTETEQRVLRWVSEGYLTHEIARGLETTDAQVGLLLRGIYRRVHLDQQARQNPSRDA